MSLICPALIRYVKELERAIEKVFEILIQACKIWVGDWQYGNLLPPFNEWAT